MDSYDYQVFPGGKGLNQSIALSRAGATVFHAGNIGKDGQWLIKLLEENRADCVYTRVANVNTGSAFIQVAANGQNSIVLNGGANRCNTKESIDEVLDNFSEGDFLLLQNEINLIDYIIDRAYEKKMFIVFNPSPMNENVEKCALWKISLFILNETEGKQITGQDEQALVLIEMNRLFPKARIVLTLGEEGAMYKDGDQILQHPACNVQVVDTTGAGDTFTGFFISAMMQEYSIDECLRIASQAAALSVTRPGAAASIPYMEEVKKTEHGEN